MTERMRERERERERERTRERMRQRWFLPRYRDLPTPYPLTTDALSCQKPPYPLLTPYPATGPPATRWRTTLHQKSTYLAQLTLGPYVVQMWSRSPHIYGGTNPSKSTVRPKTQRQLASWATERTFQIQTYEYISLGRIVFKAHGLCITQL